MSTESLPEHSRLMPLSSVLVECRPHGSCSFACAAADVFRHDELTITCTDAEFDRVHGPLRVFPPGSWAHATVYGADGHVQHFMTSTYQQESEHRFKTALAAIRERKSA